MPENYIFKGWLAFALHGWIVPPEMEEYKSQLIHAATELKSTSALGKKKHGRAQSRKEKSEKKKQELIAAPSDDGRGTTLAQKMQYASILHTIDLASRREGKEKLEFAADNISLIERTIERQMRLIDKLTSLDPYYDPTMKKLEKLEEELGNARAALDALQNEGQAAAAKSPSTVKLLESLEGSFFPPQKKRAYSPRPPSIVVTSSRGGSGSSLSITSPTMNSLATTVRNRQPADTVLNTDDSDDSDDDELLGSNTK